jgi:ABC-type uncharacterized transport system auxiliary subunit
MRTLAPLLLAAVLCGCSSGPAWQSRSYSFALPPDPPTTNTHGKSVALNRVSISPVFQSRSFTYRISDNSYEQDPYAGFLIAPERALAEPVRAWMRASGAFGRVLEPGTALAPNLVVEVSVNELYGDFRKASQPVGTMALRFICYETQDGVPRRIVLDKTCAHEAPLPGKTGDALMAAWDTDLREIMNEITSEYARSSADNQ